MGVNRKSVIMTYTSLSGYDSEVRATEDNELIEEYFYWLGYLGALINFGICSNSIELCESDLWDDLEMLFEKIEQI